MNRAIFISRTGALLAAQRWGRKRGLDDEFINLRTQVYSVFKRGQMIGWEAWLDRSPVLEDYV